MANIERGFLVTYLFQLQLRQNLTLQETVLATKQAEIQHKQNIIIREKDRADREDKVNYTNRVSNLQNRNGQQQEITHRGSSSQVSASGNSYSNIS